MIFARLRSFSLVLLLFSLSNLQGVAQSVVANSPEFTLILSPPQSLRLDDGLEVSVTLANISDHKILIALPPGLSWGSTVYGFQLMDALGNVVPRRGANSKGILHSGAGSSRMKPVDVGGSLVQVVKLTQLYEMSSGITYTLRVSLWDYGVKQLVYSAPLELTAISD